MNSIVSKVVKLIFLFVTLLCTSNVSLAQDSIMGEWHTIDDTSGKVRSMVEIYKKENLYYGKISKMYPAPDEDPNPVCNECAPDDDRYKKNVLGLEILRAATKNGDEYIDGNILDPENGKVYSCKLWIENGDLMVRGYVSIFFRTQTWVRPKQSSQQ